MLPEATADLIRRDAAIPGLALVLDADRFAERVAPRVADCDVLGSELVYVRYKPGDSCLVVQRLATAHGQREVYAKAVASHGVDKLAKARREAAEGHAGTWVLDRARVVVRAFPSDGKLHNLRRLSSLEQRRYLVGRVTATTGHSPSADAPLHRLAYKPERRFVARWGDHAGVFKFYRPEAFAAAYRAARSFGSNGEVALPRIIGRSRRHYVLAFGWLDGSPLREVIETPAAVRAVRRVGAALASLHRRPAGRLTTRGREREIAELRAVSEQLEILAPSLARDCQRLVARLSAWLSTQPAPSAAIHGDFYDKQILVRPGGIALLDLDEAAIGDPRADLGNFAAHLERDEVLGLGASRAAELDGALLDGYTSEPHLSIDSRSMYVAIGLLRLLHHPFRTGRRDWQAETRALLNRAESWAGRTGGSVRKRGRIAAERAVPPEPLVVSLNQDAGIGPVRAKGAAVHLRAMREAFASLGARVLEVDDPAEGSVRERLERAARKAPIHLIYERYALGKAAGAEFAATHRIPYVLEVNSPLAEEARRWRGCVETEADREGDRTVFSQAAAVIAVSEPVAEYSVRRGAHPDRVRVWPNAVDAERFQPRSTDDPLRCSLVPAGRFAVGFHGRLRPWHRFDVLVDVFRRLLDDGEAVHLVVVGQGDFTELLDGRVPRRYRTLIPWQPYEEIGRHVAVFDALPLTYSAELPFYFSPLKLAEAMACGVVPIVPALANLPELVRHGREGLVYPAGDAEALSSALRCLVAEPEKRGELARAARARVASMSWARIADFALGFGS